MRLARGMGAVRGQLSPPSIALLGTRAEQLDLVVG